MEIYTAQYPVRCNNNTCGLLCNLRISHMIVNYYLPYDQNHLSMTKGSYSNKE